MQQGKYVPSNRSLSLYSVSIKKPLEIMNIIPECILFVKFTVPIIY